MEENKNYSLGEIGLPRANSNGAIIIALLLLAIFFVMAYSCSSRKNKESINLDSPPQKISNNEWFEGMATGFEAPKPAPFPKDEVKDKATPYKQKALKEKPLTKKLGGEIFSETRSSQTKTQNNFLKENGETTFKTNHAESSKPRYEYYLDRDLEAPIGSYEIKAGTTLPAQLDMTINSDLGGSAVAHITRNVYDSLSGEFVLVPQGTKLYGNILTNVAFGQSRVDVIWERLIFPDSSSLVLNNMRASDSSGQTGLHHTVDNHYGRLLGGAILLSVITGGIQLSQPQESANFGSPPSISQTLSGALGQNVGQVSSELIRRQMDVRPTLIIPTGEHFSIIASKDLLFPGPFGAWE